MRHLAAVMAAAVIAAGCGSEGKTGPAGPQGLPGATGAKGDPGTPGAPGNNALPSYWPARAGIQTGLSLTNLLSAGWSVCYQDGYDGTGTSVASILSGCTGQYLMLACRKATTPDLLEVAAADTREVVAPATQDAATTTASHRSYTVGWYFTDNWSWGFYPADAPVTRDSCDIGAGFAGQRLCWHTGTGSINMGYRCGGDISFAAGFERLVLMK